jgi:hypothetical protein
MVRQRRKSMWCKLPALSRKGKKKGVQAKKRLVWAEAST